MGFFVSKGYFRIHVGGICIICEQVITLHVQVIKNQIHIENEKSYYRMCVAALVRKASASQIVDNSHTYIPCILAMHSLCNQCAWHKETMDLYI